MATTRKKVAKKAAKVGEKRKRGRPSKYSAGVAREICERLENGESMVEICARKGMPSRATVVVWQRDREDFKAECARARELSAEQEFESLRVIEEKTLSGEYDSKAASVVLSSRQWRLSKLVPRVYGQRAEIDVTSKGDKVGDPMASLGKIAEQLGGLVGEEAE